MYGSSLVTRLGKRFESARRLSVFGLDKRVSRALGATEKHMA